MSAPATSPCPGAQWEYVIYAVLSAGLVASEALGLTSSVHANSLTGLILGGLSALVKALAPSAAAGAGAGGPIAPTLPV